MGRLNTRKRLAPKKKGFSMESMTLPNSTSRHHPVTFASPERSKATRSSGTIPVTTAQELSDVTELANIELEEKTDEKDSAGTSAIDGEVSGDANMEDVSRTSQGKRPSGTIAPSARMSEFLSWVPLVMKHLHAREAGPGKILRCGRCDATQKIMSDSEPPKVYRCTQCIMPEVLCKSCMVAIHEKNPFHIVEEWADEEKRRFWRRVSLGTLGLTIKLGHGGILCEQYKNQPPRSLVLVDEHGIHSINVCFCWCKVDEEQRRHDAAQLIRHGVWPGSWKEVNTVYSIQLLHRFAKLTHQAGTSAHDFVAYLTQLTKGVDLSYVANRYREFMTAMREFEFVLLLKRMGFTGTERGQHGDLAVLCPACPQLGLNMAPDWENCLAVERFKHALFYSNDACFQQNQRNKPMDQQDKALTSGRSHHVNQDDVKGYLEAVSHRKRETPTCSNFNAQGVGEHSGVASGIFALNCARHLMPLGGGVIDLQKGERYSHVDFARLSGLQRYAKLKQHIMTYDINCQYSRNLRKRMDEIDTLLNECASIVDRVNVETTYGVPKMHIAGHEVVCQMLFSMYLLPGAAMTDGEGIERMWSMLNVIAAQLREMTTGHRQDSMSFFLNHLAAQRTLKIPGELVTKFIEAQRHYIENTAITEGLEKSIEESEWGSQELIAKWRVIEAEFKRKITDITKHAELKKNNPYEMAKKKRITQKEALKHLKNLPTSSVNGDDLLGTIQRGMSLQNERACLVRSHEAEEMVDRWEQKVEAWLESAQLWYADHDKHLLPVMEASTYEAGLSGIEDLLKPLVQSTNPDGSNAEVGPQEKRRSAEAKRAAARELLQEMEETVIRLPDAWDTRLRTTTAARAVVEAETNLRQGEANDMLEDLRTHLLVNYSLHRQRKTTTGQKAITRLQKSSKRKIGQQKDAASGYRRARQALVDLGVQEMEAFPPLKDSDVKVFALSMGHTELGGSRDTPSWIWGDVSFAEGQSNGSEYLQETIRVLWFRQKALQTRWHEELLLVPEEMARTVRFFYSLEAKWTSMALEEESRSNRMKGRAEYGRKQAYRYSRLVDMCEKAFKDIPGFERKDFDRLRKEAISGEAETAHRELDIGNNIGS